MWNRKLIASSETAARGQSVIIDFLKMFVAAILCGLGCSVVVAILTLLLSGNAEAATPETAAVPATSPGSLAIGDGCSSLALEPVERDWHVIVDSKAIEVRLMQTWLMPEPFESGVVFAAQLPPEAQLRSFSAQTGRYEWSGRIVRLVADGKSGSSRSGRMAEEQLTVFLTRDGNLTSEALIGLEPGESLTVQYTYLIRQRPDTQIPVLELSLDAPRDSNRADGASLPESPMIAPTHRPPGVGSVWVEWRGRKPARLLQFPTGAAVENTASGIAGLSWTSHALQSGDRLKLGWMM